MRWRLMHQSGRVAIMFVIATRPDWCISRQRIWGVPIAVFMCEACNQPIINPDLNRSIVDLFEREGIEAWHTNADRGVCLLRGKACTHCMAPQLPQGNRHSRRLVRLGHELVCRVRVRSRTQDRLQILPGREGTECLYLEGGDQHRGWFHSSLLTSVALRGRAPYSHVATAGWTLDEQGRAMCKSLGNGVDPVDIANRLGGEIVRLWVASIDFREDMAASENLMKRCAEIYRKLRNTFRFLLGNLNGFDPARDQIAEAEASAARPLHAGPHPRADRKDPRLVRGLRVPSRLSRGERVRHRRSEFVLPRRAQGPHVYLRAHEPRTPLRADGALEDHRGSGAPGRAHPQLYRRRGLGVSACGRGPRSLGAPGAVPEARRGFLRGPNEVARRVETDLRRARRSSPRP